MINIEILKFSLYVIPFLIIGLFLGTKVHIKINNFLFRKIISVILIIIGILLIVNDYTAL